ncbi:MAG: ribonuclease P protein component [Chloroflexi bacterium]|jgi:ribonuclease P protein component|nr:ribonuclease P protein component [Chloroflexota bacterium]
MITRPSDFAALQRDGTSRSARLLSVRVRRTGHPTTRFAFSTGKKLGGAVVRNRARRRIRESLRPMLGTLAPGWDVLVVARPATATATQADIAADLAHVLSGAGILEPEPRA